jgi:hypothetical protein
MSRRRLLLSALAAWAAVTLLGAIVVHSQARIDPGPMPDDAASEWALSALHALRLGADVPAPPSSAEAFEAAGPIFVIAWSRSRPLVRHVGSARLVDAIREAGAAFAENEVLMAQPGFRATADAADRIRYTVEVTRGDAGAWIGIPLVENLDLVPLREGLHIRLDGEDAWLTPEELHAADAYDTGVRTPIPDLTFGTDIRSLVGQLARGLGSDGETALAQATIRRARIDAIAPDRYPRRVEVTEASLREAAEEGAAFLIRHMTDDGRFTYVYDGRTGRPRAEAYNLPRHSGTTFFVAQVANSCRMPEAREAARRALTWVARNHIRRCGGPELWCVEMGGQVEMGSSALTAIAAAEYLRGGDDPAVRDLLEGLTAHMRDMQRQDGELMHIYDLSAQAPRDVQLLYYSGEAALALLMAHEVLGNEEDLEAARRLMTHLTGAGWSFLGSRYYYGEEHWTCIAAGAASERVESHEGLDFCRRWAEFNRAVQYGEGETPWDVEGAYGVGPLIIPRLTPVGSRTEAFISTYIAARRAGIEDPDLRQQIEAGLGMLLAYRWAPGPTHLLANPVAARGGIPATGVDLTVRNDFVQHAGSAMIRWADFLAEEREGGGE